MLGVLSRLFPSRNSLRSFKGATTKNLFMIPRVPSLSYPSINSLEVVMVPRFFLFKHLVAMRGKYRYNDKDCYHLSCCPL